MNDRPRQALQWLAAAAIVFIGLLLLFSAANGAGGTADPARQDLNWPVLQTIVAFVLFDLALFAGLLIARLRSRPTRLSPSGLLATAVVAALLALWLLVAALDWSLNSADLLWTLVLIAGFGLLLALGMVWLAFRRNRSWTPERPQPVFDDGSLPHAEADPLIYLTTLVGGDQDTAERLIALEQTLDPGASHRECIDRAIYKLARDQA